MVRIYPQFKNAMKKRLFGRGLSQPDLLGDLRSPCLLTSNWDGPPSMDGLMSGNSHLGGIHQAVKAGRVSQEGLGRYQVSNDQHHLGCFYIGDDMLYT